jgi:S1-C subfamily serine protease
MRPVEAASPVAAPEAPPRAERARARLRRPQVLVAVAAVVVVLAGLVWWVASSGPLPLTRADIDQAVQQGIAQEQRKEQTAPAEASVAYQVIGPSLVTVTAQRMPGTTTETSLGAGVLINADGAVLTALHVVDGAGQVQVRFADGTVSPARVATVRADQDIAVLAPARLPSTVVPAVMAGTPPIGADVFAVGNPLGLERSLSAGVVSATDRSITSERGSPLNGLIQFDAAVNPGNSGGPLLNRSGQVVGIVTALANPAKQDFFAGIAFAVPITIAGGAAGGPQK